MMNYRPTLEVIVCSTADAVEAERGGAHRLEIVRELRTGGLTPPLELVRSILAAVRIPVRIMLRENDGYTATDETEIESLCATARELSRLRVDGLVLGFLRGNEIDLDLMRRILSHAPNLKATMHHAFEETLNPLTEVKRLKCLGQVDRILTYGGRGNWSEKIVRLAMYEKAAQPEIMILVGGGLSGQVIETVWRTTRLREFHVGRAARARARQEGVVQARRVRELVNLIEANSSATSKQVD